MVGRGKKKLVSHFLMFYTTLFRLKKKYRTNIVHLYLLKN